MCYKKNKLTFYFSVLNSVCLLKVMSIILEKSKHLLETPLKISDCGPLIKGHSKDPAY